LIFFARLPSWKNNLFKMKIMKKILLIIGVCLVTSFRLFGVEVDENTKTIYLCGENHYNSDEDSRFQMFIMQLASQKLLVYAKEGLEREVQAEKEFSRIVKAHFNTAGNPLIFGVEDPLFIIFKEALNINVSLTSIEKSNSYFDTQGQEIYESKKNDILCPLVHKANQKFLNEFWENKELIGNPIFDYLKENKSALIKKDFKAQTKAFKPQLKRWTDSKWIDFTREIVLVLEPMVSQQIPEEKLDILAFLLSCLNNFKLGSNCDSEDPSLYFMKKLHLELRNDFIVNNIVEIYSFSKGKPVVCILGEAHIEGVKANLQNKGFIVLGKNEFLNMNRKTEKIEL